MSEITFAFIIKGEQFIPSHVNEVRQGDIYYLVVGGKPSTYFSANQDAHKDPHDNWDISGTPIESTNIV